MHYHQALSLMAATTPARGESKTDDHLEEAKQIDAAAEADPLRPRATAGGAVGSCLSPRVAMLVKRFGVLSLLAAADVAARPGSDADASAAAVALSDFYGADGSALSEAARVVQALRAGSASPAPSAKPGSGASAPPWPAAEMAERVAALVSVRGSLSHHELTGLDVSGALALWLAADPDHGRAFLDRALRLDEGTRGVVTGPGAKATSAKAFVGLSVASGGGGGVESAEGCALGKLLRQAQNVVTSENCLPSFRNRSSSDILETTSKSIDLVFAFTVPDAELPTLPEDDRAAGAQAPGAATSLPASPMAETSEAAASAEDSIEAGVDAVAFAASSAAPAAASSAASGIPLAGDRTAPGAADLSVKATRTAHIGEVVAHLLRTAPVAAWPAAFTAAARSLVGATVRERPSAAWFRQRGDPWRTADVVAFDAATGAHHLRYRGATAGTAASSGERSAQSSPGSGRAVAVAAVAEEGGGGEDCWVRLTVRDVVVLRWPFPTPTPAKVVDTSHSATAGAASEAMGSEALSSRLSDGPCTVSVDPTGQAVVVVSGAARARCNGRYVARDLAGYRGAPPLGHADDASLAMVRWKGSRWVIIDVGPGRDQLPDRGGVELYGVTGGGGTPPLGAWAPAADSPPRCERGHKLALSDGRGSYVDFNCNGCRRSGSWSRWFCPRCSYDLCFACHPSPPSTTRAGQRVQLRRGGGKVGRPGSGGNDASVVATVLRVGVDGTVDVVLDDGR
jgi:hypothetical protein